MCLEQGMLKSVGGTAPLLPLLLLTILQGMASSEIATQSACLGLSAFDAGRRGSDCSQEEGVWSQAKLQCRLDRGSTSIARSGVGNGARYFSKCGRDLSPLSKPDKGGERASRVVDSVAVTCAAFERSGGNGAHGDHEFGKKSCGDESLMAIRFERGQDPPTVVYAPGRRIVSIGDMHGDLERAQEALELAGVLSKDGKHRWTGGTTILMQIGDVLDRGEDEIAILSLLASLGREARSKGGAVFQLLGNHETMNLAGDFRYVAPGGFLEAEAFAEYMEEGHGGNWDSAFEVWHEACKKFKKRLGVKFSVTARSKLLSPGGLLATHLATHRVVLKVNDWLFLHGGLLPYHVEYGLERMNQEVSSWMKKENDRWGQPVQMPRVAVIGSDSVVWSRQYSKDNFDRPQERIQTCETLTAVLSATNSRGLIVGHTPQTIGANSECDGRVWRIDVGMSSGVLHALPEVLEIVDDKVRISSAREEFSRMR